MWFAPAALAPGVLAPGVLALGMPALWVAVSAALLLAIWHRHRRRRRRGTRRGMPTLAAWTGYSIEDLRTFRPRYQQHRIPKRRGGWRQLDVPSDETKRLQRVLLRKVLAGLPAHPQAMGFEKGRSIVDNARPHVGAWLVLKLDVEDFFPSTSADRVHAWFRTLKWSKEAASVLTGLTTYDDRLPQGAPTSPRIANLVNVGIDANLEAWAQRHGGAYTRYADDITFSFRERLAPAAEQRRLLGTIHAAKRVLAGYGYRMHGREKLRVMRRTRQQRVTGLVVNERVQLPRATRRWLRAVKHRHAQGKPITLTPAQLQGWLAFEHMIERATRSSQGQAPQP